MRISIILGHPNPGSFNHALAAAVQEALQKNGHQVILHDLHKEGFDPILPAPELGRDAQLPPLVKAHCDEIIQAEGIVIIHPNWWGQPPAIMKGWVDRVLRQGTAYKFGVNDKGEGIPIGLLKAQAALVLTTSNTPPERELEDFGDPLDNLWKRCIFNFCGIQKVERRNFEVVIISTPDQREKWLEDAAEQAQRLFPRK